MKLVAFNDPILFELCVSVTDIESQVVPHIAKMDSLVYANGGLGLAAPQVGILLRFFVMGLRVCINPSVHPTIGSGLIFVEEGCLSRPGFRRKIPRHSEVHACYTKLGGEAITCVLTGMDAIVFQHECDHLDGKCIFPRP